MAPTGGVGAVSKKILFGAASRLLDIPIEYNVHEAN